MTAAAAIDDKPKAKFFREKIGEQEYELEEVKLDAFDEITLWPKNPRLVPFVTAAGTFQSEEELENLLRREDASFVKADDIKALAGWTPSGAVEKEISFMPARVLLQDFTGVPCVVDLAAMRDAMVALNGDPNRINPLQPGSSRTVTIEFYVSDHFTVPKPRYALQLDVPFPHFPPANATPTQLAAWTVVSRQELKHERKQVIASW